ncbi:MAG: beta-N-acetylhexosaminidase [Alphaproteobacteria bacterium]|nr:beta-N-acetylhexosaminidase [Alphaproteobacteria bacterium]
MQNSSIKSAIIGIAGHALNSDEIQLLQRENPYGVILFARNCDNPEQIRALTQEIRVNLARPDAPILIDQEGGRVQRLKPPNWLNLPAAARIGALYDRDADRGLAAALLLGQILGQELAELGINVDCAPVIDLIHQDTHVAIGDRAFHADPFVVIRLAQAVIKGLAQFGVMSVIKHAPGHGRAILDSHYELPQIACDYAQLMATDFLPFASFGQQSQTLPAWVMTAHICYECLDPTRPVTLSPFVIEQILRRALNLDLPIISDDLGMKALHKITENSPKKPDQSKHNQADPTDYQQIKNAVNWGELVRNSIAAGCDLVLHCSGKIDESQEVLSAAPPLANATQIRLNRAWKNLVQQNTSRQNPPGLANLFHQAEKLWQFIA